MLLAGILAVGGCGEATTLRSDAPAPTPTATTAAAPTATLPPTATPAPTATLPPTSAPAVTFTVDCGPLTACLQVVAAAEAGLDVIDRPPYARARVLPFETHWTLPPVASTTPAPGASPPVEIETLVMAHGVEFSWPSESQVIPVFRGANGWTPGLPPAATRVYRFARDVGTWTEPSSFALGSAEYALEGGCAGYGSIEGEATVTLVRVAEGGSNQAEAARLVCGPAIMSAGFGQSLRLAAGRYRLAVEDATGTLEVRLEPVTAE